MKKLKTSQDVREYFANKKSKDGIIPFKGGYAVCVNSTAKEIFVNTGAKQKAEKRLKELTNANKR